jgi:hypothetical protein
MTATGFPFVASRHDPGCKRLLPLPKGVTAHAEFGGDNGEYRYKLLHHWVDNLPKVLFILMNPSAASEQVSDATAAKCGRLARRWGFGAMYLGNVCAYRATHPRRLCAVSDPVGPRNSAAVLEMAAESSKIVVAHGHLPAALRHHADSLVEHVHLRGYPLFVLGFSGPSHTMPIHPLARGRAYVAESVLPQIWKDESW